MRSFAPTTRPAERALMPGRIVFSAFARAPVAAPSTPAAAEARFKKALRLDGIESCVIRESPFVLGPPDQSERQPGAELDGAWAVACPGDPAEVGAALSCVRTAKHNPVRSVGRR